MKTTGCIRTETIEIYIYRQGYVNVVRWHLDLEPTHFQCSNTAATVRIRGSVIHMEFLRASTPRTV
jgi:hypothetical protein